MIELVVPGNPEELVAEAKKLGFKEVILCYKKIPKNKPKSPGVKIGLLLHARR